MYRLGFVGYGLRGRTISAAFERLELPVQIAAVADPQAEMIKGELTGTPLHALTAYYPCAGDMYRNEALDGVVIAARCHQHVALAEQAYAQGLPVFLEKPVCIDFAGYRTLHKYVCGPGERTLVSFPLRLTAIVQEMRGMVASGALGEIVAVQAVNNVPYGSVYYHGWYRDSELTGGLFMQKMTHDIDYIAYICGARLKKVASMSSLLYFKGNNPASLRCPDCAAYHTCLESSYVVSKYQHETPNGDACCFTTLTGNDDTASVLFQTDTGAIINYSQVFVVKKSACRRGARVVGTHGSAEFDFYTGIIRQDCYFEGRTITHAFAMPKSTHYGGDDALASAFVDLLDGKSSIATLEDGLISARACLAAKESARTGKFVEIG